MHAHICASMHTHTRTHEDLRGRTHTRPGQEMPVRLHAREHAHIHTSYNKHPFLCVCAHKHAHGCIHACMQASTQFVQTPKDTEKMIRVRFMCTHIHRIRVCIYVDIHSVHPCLRISSHPCMYLIRVCIRSVHLCVYSCVHTFKVSMSICMCAHQANSGEEKSQTIGIEGQAETLNSFR